MNILQVNKRHWDHVGGIETVVKQAYETFRELGHHTTVLAVNEGPETRITTDDSLKVIQAGEVLTLFGMPLSWKFFRQARQAFQGADFIVLHHPFPLGLLVYLLFGQRKPAVIWFHSDIIRQKLAAKLLRPLLVQAFKKVQAILVSTDRMVEKTEFLRPFAGKAIVIPYAVSLLPKTEAAEQIRQQYPAPLLLSVGRLVYYKGYEYLLEAMQGVNAHLLIIGTGPLKQKLEQQIAELGLRNVSIIDPVADLAPYYHACDMLVFPSVENSEAFGLVQVEAMLAGKPVINTDLPTSVPRVSIHNETGLTVPPRDSDALKTAINRLLNDSEFRLKLGAAARQRAETEFSREAFNTRLSELLKTYHE